MDLTKYIKPLSGELDWPVWKRKIRDLLDYHEGALDAIDKKLVKPEDLAADAKEPEIKLHKEKCDLFRKANSYAKTMITGSVTDEVYQKIMDKETANETWEALKQLFEATSKDQLFKVCTDFFSFSWTPGDDVSTHIAKLKSLWNQLNNGLKAKNENELPDLMLIFKILHILPAEFETFSSSWMLLTKDETKTLDELTTQLCMYERNFRKIADSNKFVQEALFVKTTKQKQNSKVSSFQKKSKKEDICNYCKKKGHWVKSCRQWISDGKPKKKEKSETDPSETNVILVSTNEEVCATDTLSTDWWFDNGATKHVTNCFDYFKQFEYFSYPCSIKAAESEAHKALRKGKIQIISKVNNKSLKLTLEDVCMYQLFQKIFFLC